MDSQMLLWMAVPLIVWFGVFAYMLSIDRKLARIEADKKEDIL